MKKIVFLALLVLLVSSPALAQENLISNGDFECNCLDGWTYFDADAIITADAAHNGSYGALILGRVFSSDFFTTIPETYQYSAWIKVDRIGDGGQEFSVEAHNGISQLGILDLSSLPLDTWTRVTFDFHATTNQTQIIFHTGFPLDASWNASIDDVSVTLARSNIYLPYILTHTLSSGQILQIPYTVSLGDIIITSLALIWAAVISVDLMRHK